jgi:hypothetical protein
MYGNVAAHAWSPPNFPHSEEEANGRNTSLLIANFQGFSQPTDTPAIERHWLAIDALASALLRHNWRKLLGFWRNTRLKQF